MAIKYDKVLGKLREEDAGGGGGGTSITIDTKANILATASPSSGDLAYATDTKDFYIYEGSDWYVMPAVMLKRTNIDAGWRQTHGGYEKDYITNKTLHNIAIGGSDWESNGVMQVDIDNTPDTLEIYLRDQWNQIVYDLTTTYGDFRHAPFGDLVYVWTGDSVADGLNGQPIMQEYKQVAGCMGAYTVIDGGNF